MFFDKVWSRNTSDKVAFEKRLECKEGGSWGTLVVFKHVAENLCGWSKVRARRRRQRDSRGLTHVEWSLKMY